MLNGHIIVAVNYDAQLLSVVYSFVTIG